MISRFYEQFSRSSRNLYHFWKFEKISNSWNTNISNIILKRVIWRFQIYNFFAKCLNFAKIKATMYFEKFLNAFVTTRNLNFSRNKLYIWNLQITHFKMISDMFVFKEFVKSFENYYPHRRIVLFCKFVYIYNIYGDGTSYLTLLNECNSTLTSATRGETL